MQLVAQERFVIRRPALRDRIGRWNARTHLAALARQAQADRADQAVHVDAAQVGQARQDEAQAQAGAQHGAACAAARSDGQQVEDARCIVVAGAIGGAALAAQPLTQRFEQWTQVRHVLQVEQHRTAADKRALRHAQQHGCGRVGGNDAAVSTHQHHAVLHVVDHQPVDELLQAQLALAGYRQPFLRNLTVRQAVHHRRGHHVDQAVQPGRCQARRNHAVVQHLQERIGQHHDRCHCRREQREEQARERTGGQHRHEQHHCHARRQPRERGVRQPQKEQIEHHIQPDAELESRAPPAGCGKDEQGHRQIRQRQAEQRFAIGQAGCFVVLARHHHEQQQHQRHGGAAEGEIAQQPPLELRRIRLQPDRSECAPGVQAREQATGAGRRCPRGTRRFGRHALPRSACSGQR